MPIDRFDEELLARVHPEGWANPEPCGRYHLVVIGAGTAGLVAAAGAAGLGARVALIERGALGGDCLNFGCVPSKSLISSARMAARMREAAAWGIHGSGGTEADFAAVMTRMRRLRAQLSRRDSAERFRALGVDVFLGEARFCGKDAVTVAGRSLRFRRAIIATGARAAIPKIPGLDEAGYATNETIFSLTERPGRLAVIGGGPLGCELAQAFQRLGSRVHLLHRHPRLMDKEEPEASALIEAVFAREGIRLHLGTEPVRVELSEAGKRLLYRSGAGEGAVEADLILVATGRTPNVDGLDCTAAGVAWDAKRGVWVDDRLRTTNPAIYAAGDVCLAAKFTHAADASARVALRNALFWGRQHWGAFQIPHCTYTDPEVAQVGLTEREAQAKGLRVTAFTQPLSAVDRAVLEGEEEGFVQVLAERDRLVGATVVSRNAGEMIGQMSLAMSAGLGLKQLASAIAPYPTTSEAFHQITDQYLRSRLTPFLQSVIGLWLRLLR